MILVFYFFTFGLHSLGFYFLFLGSFDISFQIFHFIQNFRLSSHFSGDDLVQISGHMLGGLTRFNLGQIKFFIL